MKNITVHDIFTKVTTAYIYLMITAFLFYCGQDGYLDIGNAKYYGFLILCGGYLICMVLLALECILLKELKPSDVLRRIKGLNLPQILILIYVGITWISAFFSEFFPETVFGVTRNEGAFTIMIYGLCFLLVSIYGNISKGMFYVLGIAVTIFSLIGIVQTFGYNPFHLFPDGLSYLDAYEKYSGEYLTTIGNADLVAGFLCLVIPIFGIAFLKYKEKERYLLLIPFLTATLLLIKMKVLAGLVGVFVGGLLIVPIVLEFSPKLRNRYYLTILVLILIFLLLMFSVDIGEGFFHEIHDLLHGEFGNFYASGRIMIWKNIITTLPDHFLLGTGPDTMKYADFPGFSKYDEASQSFIIRKVDVAHNEFLNVLYHQGIFALLAYLAAILVLLKGFLQKGSKEYGIMILGGSVACYLVQSFFGFSMVIVAPYFWIALGLLTQFIYQRGKEGKEQ